MHPLLQLDEFLEVTNYIRKAHQDGEASHGMESTQMTWVLRANAGPTFHLRMTRYCCVILTSSMPASTRRLHAPRTPRPRLLRLSSRLALLALCGARFFQRSAI